MLASGLLMASQLHIARRMVMTALAAEIRETCNFSTPGESGMKYVDRVDTPWPLRYQLPIGAEVPFHCTASGKMYLASNDDTTLERMLDVMPLTHEGPNSITDKDALRREIAAVRKAGHAWDSEEFMAGMVAMAAPVRDPDGRLAATIAFHAPLQRMSFEAAAEWVPRLKKAAVDLEVLLFGDDEGGA